MSKGDKPVRKFKIINSSGSAHTVTCSTKWEANKLAKDCEKHLNWKIVKVEEVK